MVSLLLVSCFGCLLGLGSCVNYRPIIGRYIPPAGARQLRATHQHISLPAGIVSEEVSSGKSSYIAASYVKYVESAGAQVVPILYPCSSVNAFR